MKRCSTPNCRNKYRKCGFCGPCYYGYITYGDPLFRVRTVGKTICTLPGCEEKHFAKGYCKPHYVKWAKYGDPLHSVYEMHHGPICSVVWCDEKHYAKGHCLTHRKRFLRKGHTGLDRNFQYKGKRLE